MPVFAPHALFMSFWTQVPPGTLQREPWMRNPIIVFVTNRATVEMMGIETASLLMVCSTLLTLFHDFGIWAFPGAVGGGMGGAPRIIMGATTNPKWLFLEHLGITKDRFRGQPGIRKSFWGQSHFSNPNPNPYPTNKNYPTPPHRTAPHMAFSKIDWAFPVTGRSYGLAAAAPGHGQISKWKGLVSFRKTSYGVGWGGDHEGSFGGRPGMQR